MCAFSIHRLVTEATGPLQVSAASETRSVIRAAPPQEGVGCRVRKNPQQSYLQQVASRGKGGYLEVVR